MDEPILDPAAPVADPTGDPTPVAEPAAAASDPVADALADPAAAAPVDELSAFDKLFGDLKPDDPAAVDPNAPPAVVAPEVSRALSVSEYVKDASQLENAVRAADEVFQVQTGKIPAHQMLEGFRARDPQGFEKIVTESLVPYLEHILGKKFGDGAAAAPDPLKTMEAKIAELEARPALEAQQRQFQQERQQADTATRTHVDSLIKAGSGIFDGATDDAISAMAAQLPKLGIDMNKLMAEVRAGKTENLDRAYKAAERVEMLRVKAMGSRLIARSKALKAAVPPGRGNPGSVAVPAGELSPTATREEMVAFLKGA